MGTQEPTDILALHRGSLSPLQTTSLGEGKQLCSSPIHCYNSKVLVPDTYSTASSNIRQSSKRRTTALNAQTLLHTHLQAVGRGLGEG